MQNRNLLSSIVAALLLTAALGLLGSCNRDSPASGSLDSANSCSKFIREVQAGVPPERATTRHQLDALQAALFVNDYIAAARSPGQSSLELSRAAIEQAFSSVSADRGPLANYLHNYSSRPESLARHYDRLRRQNETSKQIAAVEEAIRKSGAAADADSDLLLDCLRLAVADTQARDFYGPGKGSSEQQIPDPSELAAYTEAFGRVFSYRFIHRYGLKPDTAADLVSKLAGLRIDGLSPADLEYPAELK